MADEEPIVADEEVAEEEPVAEEEEDFVAAEAGPDIKLFGKWSFDDIEIRDISLEVSYRMYKINLNGTPISGRFLLVAFA